MSFRPSAWAIRNPTPIALLFAALVILGMAGFFSLPIKAFPNISFPIVQIEIGLSGAAASEVENQVTIPLEASLSGITNVRHIDSTASLGQSSTTIEFEFGSDMVKALDDVRAAVDQARANLPSGIDPPLVIRVDLDSTPIMTYAISADDMAPSDLSWFIDDTLARTLRTTPGVSQVTRVGGINPEINVTVDPEKMAAQGVTAPQVNQALVSANLNVSGGQSTIGDQQQTVRVIGEATSIDAIRNLTIPVSGHFVKLSDIAQVDNGASQESAFARLDGRPVVAFQVSKTANASDVTVQAKTLKLLDQISKEHPDVHITKIFSTVDNTLESYNSTMEVLFEGMILAALVVFAFLREWRATVIAAVAMPLSLIPTFAVMALFHYSLDVISLLALTLVIGILVDDAIVEIENIQKRIEWGATPYRASLLGADSIGLAVIATTSTIVGVFAPVSGMSGTIGQFFKEFGLTVAVAVLFSLLVARLLTPLLAAYFLKPSKHPKPRKPFEGRYKKTLDFALNHPWLSSIIGGVLVVVSFACFAMFVPFGFQPADNSGTFYETLTGPPGSTHDDMELAVQRATKSLLAHKEVTSVFAQVGASVGGGFGGGAPASVTDATLTVQLSKNRGGLTTEQFRQKVQPELLNIPDVRVSSASGFGGSDVTIVLSGDDEVLLENTRQTLMRQMRGVNDLTNIRPSPAPPGPELVITPKPEEAARLGVTAPTLAQVMRIATLGDIDANSAKYSSGDQRIPIRVRLPQSAQMDLQALGQLRVPTASGGMTPLSAVADLSFDQGPGQIARHDRQRQVTVEADLNNGATSTTAIREVHALPIMKKLPTGVVESPAGDEEQQIELLQNFMIALATGLALVYIVLILLFRSFFKALTIIVALPLIIVGVATALILTGIAATMPVFIGLLMLFGLAGKNSILLVEFAIEAERKGMSRIEAIHEACRERARPIIMTTLAMIAGMAPTALGLGEGANWRQPMAVAVIGGLISSTALSLVLVPVIYEIIDKFEAWLTPKFSGFVTKKQPGDDAPIEEGA